MIKWFFAWINGSNKIHYRIEEETLQKMCGDAAAAYVTKKYSQSDIVDKHLLMNAFAHGFYMGYRHMEKMQVTMTDGQLEAQAEDAAQYYILQKVRHAPSHDRNLIIIGVQRGFVSGARAWKKP